MNSEYKTTPQAIICLKDALSVIYWKKEYLQDFIKLSLVNNSIVGAINWGGTKREAVKELIERMLDKPGIYNSDLNSLFLNVSTFNDFSNLKPWDDDNSKTKAAKAAVEKLKIHTKEFTQRTKEQEEAQSRRHEAEKRIIQNKSLSDELYRLKERFYTLTAAKDLQKRGFELEKFLYDLFLLYELEPKGSFKIYGEQIDGAFTFQGADYLLEAKWKRQVDRGELASFCQKVDNKFKTALGLLVTIDGVTSEAISPYFKSIIIMDGRDIMAILEERVSFPDLLFKKRRRAIETGDIYLNFDRL